MQLEQQVVSLDLAKRLKELGVKQKGLFYWCKPKRKKKWVLEYGLPGGSYNDPKAKNWKLSIKAEAWEGGEICSAFTVAELGEMLPCSVHTEKYPLGYKYQCHYQLLKDDMSGELETKHFEAADTEADARAKVLIYLLENKNVNALVINKPHNESTNKI